MTERNMYTCLPCPACGSRFRCAFGGEARNGKKYGVATTIDCDDCGHVTEGVENGDGEWNDGRVLHPGGCKP